MFGSIMARTKKTMLALRGTSRKTLPKQPQPQHAPPSSLSSQHSDSSTDLDKLMVYAHEYRQRVEKQDDILNDKHESDYREVKQAIKEEQGLYQQGLGAEVTDMMVQTHAREVVLKEVVRRSMHSKNNIVQEIAKVTKSALSGNGGTVEEAIEAGCKMLVSNVNQRSNALQSAEFCAMVEVFNAQQTGNIGHHACQVAQNAAKKVVDEASLDDLHEGADAQYVFTRDVANAVKLAINLDFEEIANDEASTVTSVEYFSAAEAIAEDSMEDVSSRQA